MVPSIIRSMPELYDENDFENKINQNSIFKLIFFPELYTQNINYVYKLKILNLSDIKYLSRQIYDYALVTKGNFFVCSSTIGSTDNLLFENEYTNFITQIENGHDPNSQIDVSSSSNIWIQHTFLFWKFKLENNITISDHINLLDSIQTHDTISLGICYVSLYEQLYTLLENNVQRLP